MPLNIRSEEVNQLAERLAKARRTTKTEAVKLALVEALGKEAPQPDGTLPLWERTRAIREQILSHEPTGLAADKAFNDALYED
jgi:antitoxin VapB